jgi:CYTH domain-containing protein
MGKEVLEIERRWLMINSNYQDLITKGYTIRIIQIYLNNKYGYSERVRQVISNKSEFLHTLKRPAKVGQVEIERQISFDEYIEMISRKNILCETVIKDRTIIPIKDNLKIEIDKFFHPIQSVLMEIEIPSMDYKIELPEYIKDIIEITEIKDLSNAKIALNPNEAIKKIKDLTQAARLTEGS